METWNDEASLIEFIREFTDKIEFDECLKAGKKKKKTPLNGIREAYHALNINQRWIGHDLFIV